MFYKHLLIFLKKSVNEAMEKETNNKNNWIAIWLAIYEDNILNTEIYRYCIAMTNSHIKRTGTITRPKRIY